MDQPHTLRIRRLSDQDYPQLHSALVSAGLPSEDIRLPGRTFYRFDRAGVTLGYGGFERYGDQGLLRSLVIEAAHRGQGWGMQVTAEIEALARAAGILQLHLLTTSATAFFESCGYRVQPRAMAPLAIAGTTQFQDLCPASATYLSKTLAPGAAGQ
ncbi:MAG: arsenic resistance N-acetyltransferase ArsN2 [Pseudomonas sp.]|uniref:arsenic resistance N-acetyltransferase ArsN2 n=1 Tax=Pseudomonas sp. TaxID=306 RepID=UPI00339AEE54